MGYVDQLLYEFEGHLTKDDIYGMTYKEIGYMRRHRMSIWAAKNKAMEEAQAEAERKAQQR